MYSDFRLIPNNRTKSSSSCCDGVGNLRQRKSIEQNLVAREYLLDSKFQFAMLIWNKQEEILMIGAKKRKRA